VQTIVRAPSRTPSSGNVLFICYSCLICFSGFQTKGISSHLSTFILLMDAYWIHILPLRCVPQNCSYLWTNDNRWQILGMRKGRDRQWVHFNPFQWAVNTLILFVSCIPWKLNYCGNCSSGMILECDFARLYGNHIALMINSGYKEPYFKADRWIRNDGMAVTSLINHSRRGALENNIYKQAGYAVDNVNVVDMYWNMQTQGTDICMAQQHLVDQGLLIIAAWRSHSKTPHSLGLLWTSDQPDAETCTWRNTTLKRDRYSYRRRDSNPQSQQASAADPRPRNWILQKTKIILAIFIVAPCIL